MPQKHAIRRGILRADDDSLPHLVAQHRLDLRQYRIGQARLNRRRRCPRLLALELDLTERRQVWTSGPSRSV